MTGMRKVQENYSTLSTGKLAMVFQRKKLCKSLSSHQITWSSFFSVCSISRETPNSQDFRKPWWSTKRYVEIQPLDFIYFFIFLKITFVLQKMIYIKKTMEGIVRSLNPSPKFLYRNYPATWRIFYQLYLHMKYGQGKLHFWIIILVLPTTLMVVLQTGNISSNQSIS